jgi:hypothetical protein
VSDIFYFFHRLNLKTPQRFGSSICPYLQMDRTGSICPYLQMDRTGSICPYLQMDRTGFICTYLQMDRTGSICPYLQMDRTGSVCPYLQMDRTRSICCPYYKELVRAFGLSLTLSVRLRSTLLPFGIKTEADSLSETSWKFQLKSMDSGSNFTHFYVPAL